MRILRIVSAGYEQGGVENGIVLTNEKLRAQGHEVRVLSSDVRPDMPHYSDYEFKSVPGSGIKKVIYAAFNYDAYKAMRRVLKGFAPDVVLLHTLSQPTAAVLFPLRKYPTILFVHGPEMYTKSLLKWYLRKDDYRHGTYDLADLTLAGKLHYWYFKYVCASLYKLAWRNIDKVIALSSYTQGFLRSEGIEASYTPNGAQVRKPSPLPTGPPVLLYAGRLEKFKGVDVLLQAMPTIIKQIPSASLLVAGEGGYAAELQQMANELGIAKHITFLGHQTQTQLEESYRRCHLFVMPSIWPETFGKVGIEAMSIGRPVIASDVGGVRDWLNNGVNGRLVEPGSSEQIADRVVEILSDKHKLKIMANEAQKTAAKFSINAFAHNIEHQAQGLTVSRVKRVSKV